MHYAPVVDAAGSSEATGAASGWDSLLDGLRLESATTVERTVERMRSLPSYADLDTEALRVVVRRNHDAILDGLALRRPPAPTDASDTFADTAATRARQAVATSDMLAAWRIGQESLYLLASTLAPAGEQRDLLLREFLELVIGWVDFAMLAAADGHRRTELALAREQEHAQANLIRRMVSGAIAPAEIRMALLPLGVDPDATYYAIRTYPTPTVGIIEIDRYLGMDVPPARGHGLVALIDGDIWGFTRKLPNSAAPAPVGISEPMHLQQFATAFRHATRALDTARALGAIGVFSMTALGVHAAVVNDPDVGDVLLRRYVHSLEAVTGGDAILATVESFLNNDFRVDTTARELSVHSNTVRQRLARFEETTGRSLHEAEALVEVWWALQRRRLI